MTKGSKKGYFFDELIEKNSNSIVSIICVIVREATKIPFAIFTDLFLHRFKKKPYLESTLAQERTFLDKYVVDTNNRKTIVIIIVLRIISVVKIGAW